MTFEDFQEESPTSPAYGRPRILLAEDDAALRRMIGTRLRRDCFDVVEAVSGDDALSILKMIALHGWPLEDLDLIIMDVRMPGVSGLELASLLREAKATTPIVLMTAYPDEELLAKTASLGVPVLAKPFDLDQLSDVAVGALMGLPEMVRGDLQH
jgi:CheY-like chemotaxis protein